MLGGDRPGVVIEHFLDGIAGDMDAVGREALAKQIFPAALGVWHEHRAALIDHAPIGFFRHAVVMATIARLHMKDGNAHSPRDECGEATVGVTEE